MNFEKLVCETLLRENPDQAYMNMLPGDSKILTVGDGDDRAFVLGKIWIKDESAPREVLAISIGDSEFHTTLIENIEQFSPNGLYELYPKVHEKAVEESFKKFPAVVTKDNPQGARKDIVGTSFYDDIGLAGRMWIHRPEAFCISLWRGEPTIVEKWLVPALPRWNPDKKPIFVQDPQCLENEWLSWDDFMGNFPQISTPEIKRLQKEAAELEARLHTATGVPKMILKKKIQELKKKIRGLQKFSPAYEDDDTELNAKGSFRDAQRAKDWGVAKMRSLEKTSESREF